MKPKLDIVQTWKGNSRVMINITRDTPRLANGGFGERMTVVPADAGYNRLRCDTGLVRAAENYTQSVAQSSAFAERAHMTAAEKERALTEFMRRDAAGEKIDPSATQSVHRGPERRCHERDRDRPNRSCV